ncbi:MAG: DNA translocase FtsK [Candidatus Latescibacteria bacterium]|nr:DNA translocase FtsK [Candidatus Latescibacterota bacterium]
MATSSVSERRLSEVLGILLIALSVLIAISLVSHSSEDYPNSDLGAAQAQNWAGKIGAQISDKLFFAFGYGALVTPVLLFLWGWNRVRKEAMHKLVARTVGILVLLVLYCSASALPPWDRSTAFKLGGTMGCGLAFKFFIPYLGRIGAAILVVALGAVVLILATGLSFGWVFVLLEKVKTIRLPLRRKKAVRKPQKPKSPPKRKERVEPKQEEVTTIRRESVAAPSMIEFHKPEIIEPDEEEEGMPAQAETMIPTQPLEILYRLPAPALLDPPSDKGERQSKEKLLQNAETLEARLEDFGVQGKVVQVRPGPVITLYEVEPAPGIKVSRIVSLSDDLAMLMRASRIRIQAPIPGRGAVGIEIPNPKPAIVALREIMESEKFVNSPDNIPLALGKTIAGDPFCADLTAMPHLLIAGATGSGKSVCINTLISSILFKSSPEDVRFIMVEPKMLELSMYNDIPHLMTPVVTDPKRASEALRWGVAEMEKRYRIMAQLGVRNIEEYNSRLAVMRSELRDDDDPQVTLPAPLSYIVVIIDELADLMMVASKDIEDSLARLAQMARAVGIHIIIATQRPSVDVITGVIKANFPTRIAFQVASKVDSRTILDANGAENLLGRGDMLFLPPGMPAPIRIHGAYISSEESERLVRYLKKQRIEAQQVEIFDEEGESLSLGDSEGRDELFDEALELVIRHQQGSTSFLQRRLKIGYARAGRLMDQLESAGIVGAANGSKAREVLADERYLMDDS